MVTRRRDRVVTRTPDHDSMCLMSEPTDSLPDDLEALRALVRSARAERDAAIAERDRVSEQNEKLRHLLQQLRRARFGRSSERLDPDQLQLALEDLEQAVRLVEAQEEKRDAKLKTARAKTRSQGRPSLPAHLPRVEEVVAPQESACPCCGGAMHVIGEDTSERLDVIPAQFRVIVTRRPKYACRACEGTVVQAPAPERLIRGGLPTEAMVAHVVVGKYAWHLPLYRQAHLALTTVNWNTTQFDQKLSAPIKAAREVGRILKHIEYGTAVSGFPSVYVSGSVTQASRNNFERAQLRSLTAAISHHLPKRGLAKQGREKPGPVALEGASILCEFGATLCPSRALSRGNLGTMTR
jgi:transposase